MLALENERVNVVGIVVIPHDPIRSRRQDRIREEIQAFRVIAPFEETRLRDCLLAEVICFGAPHLGLCLDLNRFLALDLYPRYRMIGIHPNPRQALARSEEHTSEL